MRITELKGKNMQVTPAIQAYIEKRLAALQKFCAKYSPCDVAVEAGINSKHHHKGNIFYAEFNLTLPGVLLRATATKDNLYAAIDQAKDELKRQLVDYKTRRIGAPA